MTEFMQHFRAIAREQEDGTWRVDIPDAPMWPGSVASCRDCIRREVQDNLSRLFNVDPKLIVVHVTYVPREAQ